MVCINSGCIIRTTYAFLRNVVLPPVSRYNALGEQICGCNLQYIHLDSKLLSHFVCFAQLVYGPFGQSNMHHTRSNAGQTSQKESNVPKLKSKE